MTTFYLIRHADKDVNGAVLSGRTPGVHLSEAGRRQAEGIARHLEDRPIRRICSSPLERTRETAHPLARRKGLDVETSAAIGEIDFGTWTNRSIEKLEPVAEWQRFHAFRSGVRIPDGELLLDVQARFVGEMLRLREQHPDGEVALVSHGDPIRLAVAYFAGVSIDQFSRFEIRPASVSVVAVGSYGPKIRGLNAVPARLEDDG